MKKFFIGIDVSKRTFDVAYSNNSASLHYFAAWRSTWKWYLWKLVALQMLA